MDKQNFEKAPSKNFPKSLYFISISIPRVSQQFCLSRIKIFCILWRQMAVQTINFCQDLENFFVWWTIFQLKLLDFPTTSKGRVRFIVRLFGALFLDSRWIFYFVFLCDGYHWEILFWFKELLKVPVKIFEIQFFKKKKTISS